MWRKEMELKGPKLHILGNLGTCPDPHPKNAGISMLPTPTSPSLAAEAGALGVVALATRELSAPIVPMGRILHVELAHDLQSPGIPSHTQVWGPQSAMRRQEQPPVRVGEVPAVQWKPASLPEGCQSCPISYPPELKVGIFAQRAMVD